MPAAVAGAFFAAGTIGYAAVYAIAAVVINVGLSYVAQSLAGKDSGDTTAVRDGREVTVSGTTQPRQMIYGECVTGGFIAHFGLNNTSTTNNDFLWFVIVVAGHQCEDISDIILDDRTILASEIVSNTVTNSSFANEAGTSMCYIYKHLGTHNQTYDTTLATWLSEWTSTHRGAGIAYFVIGMRKDDKAWPSGIPSNFRAKVKGKRVYDPRKDSTNGGSGSHRTNNATTWEWSRNPILCARDYLTGGSVYFSTATPLNLLGIREDNTRILDTYIAAAANICEETCNIPGPATEQRYTCDAQLSCDSTHAENMEILLSSCIGHISYVNGKYRLYAGAYQTPAITITEDDIKGAVSIPTHPQGEDLYNSVTGTFYDEGRDWQQSNFPTQTQSTYQTDDGGEYSRSIQLHATRGNYRAQRIANVHLNQSRNKITLNFDKLSLKAMNIAEWDTFYLTSTKLGYTNQAFRCTKWQFKSGWIGLEARIESSAAWADLDVSAYTDPTTNVPASSQVTPPEAPTGLVAAPAAGAIVFYVATTLSRGEVVELWEHTSSSPFSSATKIAEGNQTLFTVFKNDDKTRYYWVRKRKQGQYSATYPASTGTAVAAANVIQFVVTGNCVATNSTVSKQGGSGAWDSQAYSVKGYTSCHVTFKANAATSNRVLVGLNTDPTTDANYTSVDYAWYENTVSGNWDIYESGTYLTSVTGISTSDIVDITYDGTNVRYYLNKVLKRTVAASGLTLYLDSSFYDPGAGINSVRFGPTTNVNLVDTAQLGEESATEVYQIEEPGSDSASLNLEDAISITVEFDSMIMIEARANSVSGTGAKWTPFVGATNGQDSPGGGVTPFVHSFFTHSVTPGTYSIGCRASVTSGTVVPNDRFITITVIKR